MNLQQAILEAIESLSSNKVRSGPCSASSLGLAR
jgi:hypothetical protein